MLHKNIPLGDIHYIHNWEVANAAALAALTPVAADKGKLAWQLDTNEFFFLADSIGPVWLPALGITGPTGPIGPVGPGVPTGGAAGTILYKVSGTDFDTSWSTLAAAGIAALLNPIFACASGVGVTITNTGTGNSLLIEDSVSPDSTPIAISADGQLFIGSSTPTIGVSGQVEQVQLVGTGAASSSFGLYSLSDSTTANLRQYRRRTTGIVADGDGLGANAWMAFDGAVYRSAATIQVLIEGAPALNSTPARFSFTTTSVGATAAVERLRIGADGRSHFYYAVLGATFALTSTAASIAINLVRANNFSHTTTENTTLAAPTNPVAGQSGVITITQGATPRLLAYNTFWKFPGGVIPTLTAVAGAVDVFAYYVESATRATCQLVKDVK